MNENKTDRRSCSIYLGQDDISAIERLKRKYFRSSTTDLIRFLIQAADAGFFEQNLVHSTNKPTPARRRAE